MLHPMRSPWVADPRRVPCPDFNVWYALLCWPQRTFDSLTVPPRSKPARLGLSACLFKEGLTVAFANLSIRSLRSSSHTSGCRTCLGFRLVSCGRASWRLDVEIARGAQTQTHADGKDATSAPCTPQPLTCSRGRWSRTTSAFSAVSCRASSFPRPFPRAPSGCPSGRDAPCFASRYAP